MPIPDRLAPDYQEVIVGNGLMLGRLTIRLNNDAAWTVQIFKTRRMADELMKSLVGSYLRERWQADSLRFYRKHGMKESECLCNFYSDRL